MDCRAVSAAVLGALAVVSVKASRLEAPLGIKTTTHSNSRPKRPLRGDRRVSIV